MNSLVRFRLGALLSFALSAAPASRAGGGVTPLHEAAACAAEEAAVTSWPLGDGEWRGVVAFAEGPVRFSIAVDPLVAPIRLQCGERAVAPVATVHDGRRVTLSIDPPLGERLEGDIEGGSYVGYYHPPLPAGLVQTFPFRAERVESPAPLRSDFSGAWTFALETAEGPGVTVTALVGQGRSKVHAIWKEPDGTTRYFTGLPGGERFVLEEMGGGKSLVLGRGDPVAGTLRGEFVGLHGRVKFAAHRRIARPVINLAGR